MDAYVIFQAPGGQLHGEMLEEDVAGVEEEGLICHILRNVEMAPLRIIHAGRETVIPRRRIARVRSLMLPDGAVQIYVGDKLPDGIGLKGEPNVPRSIGFRPGLS